VVSRAPIVPQLPPLVVNDVSQLNPIHVAEVITPTTTAENRRSSKATYGTDFRLVALVIVWEAKQRPKAALFIDMRQFNRIVSFLRLRKKSSTVQAGIRWRQIQEHIDAANLSVKIMQSYANFTVGGALFRVNAHGRLCRTRSNNPIGKVTEGCACRRNSR